MIEKFQKNLLDALSDNRAWAKALLYGIGLFFLLGVLTALIPNPIIPFIRPMGATAFDYVFLTATAFLAGIYLALPDKGCSMEGTAGGGAFLGTLAFSCPTCNILLATALGPYLLFSVFDPLRPVIGTASVILLLYAIAKKTEGTDARAQ
jgi:hypothetical protein